MKNNEKIKKIKQKISDTIIQQNTIDLAQEQVISLQEEIDLLEKELWQLQQQ
mgnify:CR=1 FL=1|jgi:hypothetical protein